MIRLECHLIYGATIKTSRRIRHDTEPREDSMRRPAALFPIVIPLVALMSASAGAHNQRCCCPAVPASEPPAVAPACNTVTVQPVSASCTDARDPSDFCDEASLRVDILNFPTLTFKYKFDAGLKRCFRTAKDEEVGIPVAICAPTQGGVTICPTACPINH